MKGYKVFNHDWTCRGFQYSVGKTFEEDVIPSCCEKGFHFCTELKDCFSYYCFDPLNKIAEIEALGEIDTEATGKKHCTNKIKIVREISWEEVLKMINVGKANTGFGNTGNYNSGNYNSGNYNSGHWNSGTRNTGKNNSGHWNSGTRNTGKNNSGHYNSGINNTGIYNTGNYNEGWYNSGNHNTGGYNAGDYNSGNCNGGSYNSGHWNSGNWNSGYYNCGNCNTGDCNSGDFNKTNFSNGCFNTKESKILMFNKPSDWSIEDWRYSEAKRLLDNIMYNVLKWIYSYEMTDEEKEQHPEYEITGGYLKKCDKSECNQLWWDSLSDPEKNIIKSLPNFDAEIFKEITGIDINKGV